MTEQQADKIPNPRRPRVSIIGILGLLSLVAVGVALFLPKSDSATDSTPNPSSTSAAEPATPVGSDAQLSSNEAGERRVFEMASGVEIPFRWCPAGRFTMGSSEDEIRRLMGEDQVEVNLTHGFWIAETELTQKQWEGVMGSNPSEFKGDNLPVEDVSWDDCQEFMAKAKAPAGWTLSLPTEAQWEYACRAGTATPFSFGSELNGTQANCTGTSPYGTMEKGPYLSKTAPVGSYEANPWGLYDMHGNVAEWCLDSREGQTPLPGGVDPVGSSGSSHVYRGGSWLDWAAHCRSAARMDSEPHVRSSFLGFRPVLVAGESKR